ncbi:MAG: rhodanese-like domain-containing protein [bacterium]|nr:rhodanese-like domain-containing protein [bacterium]
MWDWFRKKNYREASIEELRTALNKPDPDTVFIDVRTETEWVSGHLGPFLHIPMSALPDHFENLKQYAHVYFLCYSGRRSERACKMLAKAGHTGAINVRGGISKWIARGYPVEH